ncbi:AraC family transcriptional regulator [Nisaea acidiphila]|uniref:AraC family transcriptional regulator n=1 Tax=Nisaea acidiphila TaxID=1862145 RepID=A0A9J7AR17_9PROT|nr:AraC family transcriptional regulator [Nisaea acidiphila]UUX49025.1 AraC family transcriptional regulator [Nisaea acidiphila]
MASMDLSFQDLSRQVRADASFYRMLGSTGEEAPVVLRGEFFIADFRSGLHIHATDAVEQSNTATELALEPHMSVSVVLDGATSAAIDGVPLNLSVPKGAEAGGLIWSVARPARLKRTIRRGQRIQKINISVSAAWIEDFLAHGEAPNRMLSQFSSTHLAIRSWRPAFDTVLGARKLLDCLGSEGSLNRLSLEMLALRILRDAFESIERPANGQPGNDRALLLRDYIAENLSGELSLNSIAAATGMSVSTMQRVFKDAFGVTVVDHLRRARLEIAHRALVEDGMPIQQAAFLAGYSSAANFATAYRRIFGRAPSEARLTDALEDNAPFVNG